MTIRSVICAFNDYCMTPHPSGPHQLGSPSCVGLQQDKKTIPDLKEFTRKDEDYYSWHDSTVNDLGKAGLIRFLNDTLIITKSPELATSVFYALQATLQNGMVSNFMTALYDDNNYNPLELWTNIEQWYDTSVNCANVVLFEVKWLLSLQLDADVMPTKFISDFNECLLWLKKNKAGLASDTDTLRALLLVVIQDDQFEPIWDSIIKEPTQGIEEILRDLCEWETSLHIKDSAHADKSIQSACQAQSSYSQNNYNSSNSTFKGWRIPKFPDSWQTAFGPKLFQMLIDWHIEAHKKASQEKLNSDIATSVKEYTARQPKQKSQHAQQPSPASTGSTTESTSAKTITFKDDGDYEECTKKHICLWKSCRVITEKKE